MKGEFYAYFETRIVCSVIFPLFYSTSFFRYIGLLTILTSGFTTTLILIVARILAFIFLIYPIVILTTEELRMEWASWIAWLLFGLIVLFFHYLAACNEYLGSWFLDFSNWLSRVPSKLWNE
ncbi:hypothetical protein P788_2863 [Enterococcus faecalis MTUP9]|nr:hypothetical protein P788_2863 [Enterococcus faecalis MTUP9]